MYFHLASTSLDNFVFDCSVHSLLKLEKYHVALLTAVVISLLHNVLFVGSKAPETSLVLASLSSARVDYNERSDDAHDSDEALSIVRNEDKIQKDGLSYRAILEDGDTLEQILSEIVPEARTAHLIAKAMSKVHNLNRLQTGEELQISFHTSQGSEVEVSDQIERVVIDFASAKVQANFIPVSSSFQASIVKSALKTKQALLSGKVTNSFFQSAQKSGVPKAVALNFIQIFSHAVDFQRDLNTGNKFKLMYAYQEDAKGRKSGGSKILYAALEVRGKLLEIYAHDFQDGTYEYFYKDGSSIRKALLRTPVKSAHISSGYGMRKHPILGYSRMHKGLDYAAPRGTPIMASGDGVVEVMKYHSTYGRYIKIKHGKRYATLYAHMDRFAKTLSIGKRVKQGDIIGYVGSTGMSTGPHLHYEVHVDGKQVNPAKVTVSPNAFHLEGQHLVAFRSKKDKIQQMLESYSVSHTSTN